MADGAQMATERWPTAVELAGLPGMPGTARGVIKMAKREGWLSRRRAGTKAQEYNLDELPKVTRDEWRRREAISIASRAAKEFSAISRIQVAEAVAEQARWRAVQRGMARYAGFTGTKRDRADARSDMVGALRSYAKARQMGLYTAAEQFAQDYNAGLIEVTDIARRIVGDNVSAVSLRRWDKAIRERSSAALAGDYGNRAGDGLIDRTPALYELVVGLLVEKPHVSAKVIYRAIQARFSGTETPVPGLRSLQRWLVAWKRDNAQVFCAVRNPDEWKNKYMVAFGSVDESIVRLNQRWEMDSTPADVMLTDGRHTIVQVCDVWSRRRMFLVSKSSSSQALCLALRRALLEWGVPELVKIDNGQDYVSHRFQRVLRDLAIDENRSAPFSPWEKPFVERGFRTFLHDLFELLPGFIGHNVSERAALEAKQAFADRLFKKNAVVEIKMDSRSLQSFCDRWVKSIYETEPRASLGKLTVQEKIASYTGTVRMVEDERMLDVLLAEAPDGHGQRVVGKKGLRIDNLVFIAPELTALVGQPVHVRYTEDVGRVVVFHDDAFVCVAECPEALGISRHELAIEAKARQTAETQAAKREVKAIARKARTHELLDEILDRREAAAENVVALPQPFTPHATDGTSNAGDAAAALDGAPQPASVTRANFEQWRDSERAAQQEQPREEDSFKRALDILLVAEADRDDIQRGFLARYSDSSEFRSRWMIFEDFGPSAFGLGDEYRALMPDQRGIDRLFDK